MKVKTISRCEGDFTKERKHDVQKVFRNYDPVLHPMERATEYVHALNATKLDKVFAKPFVSALEGHSDGVYVLTKNPQRLSQVLSGSMDGVVYLWDLAHRKIVRQLEGHEQAVRGIAVAGSTGDVCVTCSDDCTARLFKLPEIEEAINFGGTLKPSAVFQGSSGFRSVDHHWNKTIFVTTGIKVDIWDSTRNEPINSLSWGTDSVYSCKFNPSETDVFATTASDRSICLYDLRMSAPLRKLIMQTKTNKIAWNPREAFNFTAASEDSCCYSYDMRKMDAATCVHKDHVSAVMDIDYSPTGREFVTGSYDRTVRLFKYNAGRSRDVYHTKRMQRVFSVCYSQDAQYVISGSDDTGIRLWKSDASAQHGQMLNREKHKQAYKSAVKKRYKHLPEISRIDRHHHVPKQIYKATRLRTTMEQAERVKNQRRAAHSTPDAAAKAIKSARKKKIVAEVE